MTHYDPQPISDIVTTLGEGPTWSPAEGAVYWIDLIERRIHRHHLESGESRTYSVSGMPAAIVLAQGGLLVAFRNGLARLDTASGEEARLNIGIDFTRERFNDGAVDSRGRFYVGTMDRSVEEPVGALWRIDPDLTAVRLFDGVTLGNGIDWSPDDRTLYFCDSRPGLVHAFDFNADTGDTSNHRLHVDFRDSGRHPDGSAVDSDGCLWIAEMPVGVIGRYDASGQRIDEIRFPVPRATSMAFVGQDLDRLYVTTMRYGMSPEDLQSHALAGRSFIVDVGVRGLPLAIFAG